MENGAPQTDESAPELNNLAGESDQHEDAPLSIDETFEILKNKRRRIVLEYLKETDGQVKLSELADHVTALENDTDISSITSTERKRVYVGLYQFHLPKMSDMGVIDYDQDRGDITLTERGKQLYREHEQHGDSQRRWYLVYFALTAGSAVGVVLSLLFWSTALAVGLLVGLTILLGGTATFHAYSSRN